METVFISSVARGLREYRDAVYKAIEGLDGHHCIRMEDFGARNASPLDVCKAKVEECDVFVGILGHEYGSEVPGTSKSYTETEYDIAVELSKPRLMFAAPEEFPIPANLVESDSAREKQSQFRRRVFNQQQVAFFDNSGENLLAQQVVTAIHNQRTEFINDGRIAEAPTVTRLLFPFVTNQAGFDTGIAISNISSDPFGTQSLPGTCTIHYYGGSTGGRPAPPPQISGVIRGGEQLIFTFSSGGTSLITATPGFQGYIMADCRFKAAGFGFLSDAGMQRVGSCYTAQIL